MTGPTTAKGYEDTALYRYHRLVSLNDVGGEPARFGTTLAEFHAINVERARHGAHALYATSTHDTKRGEDPRVRIDVLSEISREWHAAVTRWQRMNRRHRTTVDGRPAPSANEEYFLYQTMVGAWPLDAARLRDYMLKAAREAKHDTSWTNPNLRWDEAIGHFVEAVLVPFGVLNSLAQTLIKITAPGVPDFYQGSELWDLSLVDPDNRRPVDFAHRRQMLKALATEVEAATDLGTLARSLMESPADGRVKLFVIRQALGVRRRHAELFARGDYRPLDVSGAGAEHICAFARTSPGGPAVTIVPRLLAARGVPLPVGDAYWGETSVALPAEVATFDGAGAVKVHVPLRNAFTGATVEVEADGAARRVRVGRVLANFPLALLEATP